MAQFQAYNKLLVSKAENIQNYKVGDYIMGFVFHSQYPSYRGTFLSCIDSLKVYLDGKEIPQENIYFNINGKQFLLNQFKDLYKEYWFILDKAKILILQENGLPQGTSHKIKVTMHHKIPYTGYSGSYLWLDGEDEKELIVDGEVDAL